MQIQLLYFGVLRDRFGASGERLEVFEGATVGKLMEILRLRTSNSSMSVGVEEKLWRSLAVAINHEYSLADSILREGDEVALLPPVSGGCSQGGQELTSPSKGHEDEFHGN